MQNLPEIGFVRLPQIIGKPAGTGPVPVSRSVWYAGVADGRFPKPVRLSKRCVAWRAEDIRALIKRLGGEASHAS